MRYGSVCSGIEAATMAWRSLGWHAAWFAETEAFPSAVLAHHYQEVENLGDFTTISESEPIDILVGGTPCQSFSIAGKRGGLDDPRGVLAFEFLKLAERLRPRWVVFENVPGLLSDDKGRSFGAFLGALVECGYGFAYRVLDAQHFGVPQRRKRVFVVGHLGDWRRAAAVLFERESMSGHPAPSREARQDVAPTLAARTRGGGGLGSDFDYDGGLIAGTLKSGVGKPGDPMFTVQSGAQHAVAFAENQRGEIRTSDVVPSLSSRGGGKPGRGYPAVANGIGVRRLTPRECERLQGFPDDYTLVPYRGKPAKDSPRYKALGNSMAVPVMRWVGERIEKVESVE